MSLWAGIPKPQKRRASPLHTSSHPPKRGEKSHLAKCSVPPIQKLMMLRTCSLWGKSTSGLLSREGKLEQVYGDIHSVIKSTIYFQNTIAAPRRKPLAELPKYLSTQLYYLDLPNTKQYPPTLRTNSELFLFSMHPKNVTELLNPSSSDSREN